MSIILNCVYNGIHRSVCYDECNIVYINAYCSGGLENVVVGFVVGTVEYLRKDRIVYAVLWVL